MLVQLKIKDQLHPVHPTPLSSFSYTHSSSQTWPIGDKKIDEKKGNEVNSNQPDE